MTPQQKEEYQDCVKYLMQYAKVMETDKHMQKFCLDIVKKAKFLHDLKPHLFYEIDMKQDIEDRIEFYKSKEKYNTKKYGIE